MKIIEKTLLKNGWNDITQIKSGVYGLRCKITKKWYIGVSKNILKRWHIGYELLSCKKQFKIYRALLKYGYDNFDKIILEECPVELFKSKETYWINRYDAVNSGYNLAPGGEGGFRPIGIPCSEETRRKISISRTGKKHSDETKLAFSKFRKGKSKPIGFGEKISKIRTGIPHTEERKRNISIAQKGISRWTNEAKINMSITRSGKLHPRWTPLSTEGQDFIRNHYKYKSESWIQRNFPFKISYVKVVRCIKNLKENPNMVEVSDFI